MCNYEKSRVLLTGLPGVGKTTFVKQVCEELSRRQINVRGFYTEEIRTNGTRTGFDVVSLTGDRAPMARLNVGASSFVVGRYSVNVPAFESVAIPILKKKMPDDTVIIIDEIGKMEMCSESFQTLVRDIFCKRNNNILATIPLTKGKTIPLIDSLKERVDIRLVKMTLLNRDKLLKSVADSLCLND